MKAQETTFKLLIQGEKQFQIPLYQRTYSWHREQLERLWGDICEQALADEQTSLTHFLGSIVLAPSPSLQAAGLQRWLVVDGQQRLTTLMLATCAIRDHLGAQDPQQRDRFNDLYLTNRWRQGDDLLRLMPTKADRASYLACVQSTADAGGGDGIGAAYRFFREQLLSGGEESPTPLAIENAIGNRMALVEITASVADNVHRIFESVNNTGLSLSQADLVRNWIFMLLPGKAEIVYETVWLPMQSRLSPEHLEDLFYYYLVLHGQERVRRDGIYQGMQRDLATAEHDADGLQRIVRELERRSRHLQRLVDPDTEPSPELRAAFRRLNLWGAQLAYPIILHLLDSADRGGATVGEIAGAIANIESFLVRRMICGVPTNNLNRIFNSLVAQMRPDKNLDIAVREVLSRERNFWPDNSMLGAAMRTKPFYWQGRANQRQVVLRRLAGC